MLQPTSAPWTSTRELRVDEWNDLRSIIRSESLLTGQSFTLASGRHTGYFFDMKRTMMHPRGAFLVGRLLFDKIRNDRDVQYIGGLEIGAIPLVTAVALHSWPERPVSAFFVRKITKDHGTTKLIDGQFEPGSTVILFDDVTTTGGSVFKAVNAVRDQGCKVKRVITIVDRLEGAEANLKKEGLALDHLFTTHDFSDQGVDSLRAAIA
jgi:orotate phosphoribosyltransferase